ncbi:MAG TPA: 50S ribosomal protein L17 [Patescibacteria group bacterium]|nr:50S ribosomal protein L17 [Patescibacteria group bacterium]
MRHQKTTYTLDRAMGPRNALLKNLVESLVLYAKIKTTLTKAKAVRSLAEKLVGWGKLGDLHGRRMIRRYLNEIPTGKLLSDIVPQFADRSGGYTRITPLGFRYGDGAEMVLLEYLVSPKTEKEEKVLVSKKKEKAETKKHDKLDVKKEPKKEQAKK